MHVNIIDLGVSLLIRRRISGRIRVMKVTGKQIAELANVSRGTVDKALYNRPGIKKETREKILKIANSLNYQPNIIGKTLSNTKKTIKIGVILTPAYNPFIQEVLAGINNAVQEFSSFQLEVLLRMPLTLEPVEQINLINQLELEDIAGLAVFPLDNPSVISKINAVADQGIPVCTFNSKLDSIKDICFVGQNHYKGGKVAAGLFEKMLPDGGKVAVVISSPYLSCHQDRLNGFQDRLSRIYPEINIVEVHQNQDKKENAFIITMSLCNKYPDLKGIYITGGGVGGVGDALRIAQKKVHVICHDLIPDAVDLLNAGVVDFTLGQNGSEQGYQIVKILFDYLFKNVLPSEKIFDIPISIMTSDSI